MRDNRPTTANRSRFRVPPGTPPNVAQDGSAISAEPNPGNQKQKNLFLFVFPTATGHSSPRPLRSVPPSSGPGAAAFVLKAAGREFRLFGFIASAYYSRM